MYCVTASRSIAGYTQLSSGTHVLAKRLGISAEVCLAAARSSSICGLCRDLPPKLVADQPANKHVREEVLGCCHPRQADSRCHPYAPNCAQTLGYSCATTEAKAIASKHCLSCEDAGLAGALAVRQVSPRVHRCGRTQRGARPVV